MSISKQDLTYSACELLYEMERAERIIKHPEETTLADIEWLLSDMDYELEDGDRGYYL